MGEATEQTLMQTGDKLELILNNYEDLSMQLLTDSSFMQTLTSYNDPSTTAYEKLALTQVINDKLNMVSSGKLGIAAMHLVGLTENSKVIGVGAISTNAALREGSYLKEDWFKRVVAADGALVWLESRKGGYAVSGEENYFGVARVLRNATLGSKEFVLLMDVQLSYLDKYVSQIKIGQTGYISIFNNDNLLIRAADRAKVGSTFEIPLSKEEKEASLSGAKTKNAVLDGQDQLVVYKQMKVSGWTIAAVEPVSELISEAKKIRDITYWMAFLSIVVVSIAGWLVARMIGKPLQTLRNLMKEGEQGNLTVRTNFSSKDEIGQVGASFNQMMSQITRLVQQTNHSASEVLSTAGVLLNSSKQTATSAKEIAVATEEIASGASSLAVEAERGNGLTHDISVQMKEVVQSNVQMGAAASEVQKASRQGTQYMAELTTKTGATEEMTRSMVEKVDRLKESTSSIRKILEMLNNITKQTNILSLNATIEAARAGAAGKGFMVVADEIRKLAEQSKQSIQVVGEITETIQTEVDETVAVLSDAYPLFKEQIQSVKEAELIFGKVQEQMSGFVDQLSDVTESIQQLENSQSMLTEAMSNVSAVSEESSATSQEVASLSNEQLSVSEGLVKLSENLEGLSTSLQESLSKFRV
ncbi:methyl-accepting chemotaxis protein [Paenibacillus sp. CC-CFT747]|nr:methyl-accepting chemotaxis protein [Paenibacillus sp. CC-CFT747]